MKAVALTRYLPIDDPQSLLDVELETPIATGHDILVRVEAVSVNPVDTKVRAPKPQIEAQPKVLGYDAAGVVEAIGEGVTDIAPGERVMGIGPEAFSTHMVVAREGLMRLPSGMDLTSAATVPVAFLTAYYAMVELGRIRAGETILIHGAAGGVGLAALQIAKLKGATVIATAGTLEKRRFLSMLGADHVFEFA